VTLKHSKPSKLPNTPNGVRIARVCRSYACACILLAVSSGCGLFEPRDPEEPISVRSTYTPPTEPAMVLENMAAALRELNSVNYLRCLSDTGTGGSFQFIPTPAAAGIYSVFAGWDRSSEEAWFLNARSRLPSGSTMNVQFSSPVAQGVQPDSVAYDVPYDLSVPHGQAGLAQRVVGRSYLTLVLDRRTGLWSIRRWQDVALSSSQPTWSDVKGGLSQ
jgi:hypothetical protein